MAGRIRTIKPEILEDERTAGLSHEAWRMFVSMWILADDHGALRSDPSWLEGQVFWGSPIANGRKGVEDALDELVAADLISLYEVRGQRYIQITKWSKHQKVDHPSNPRVPRPNDEAAWPVPKQVSDKVYFIRARSSGAIKIGVSWNPSRRLASLQAAHHDALELMASTPGDISSERTLHKRFSASRVSGEWFSPSPELIEFIDTIKRGATLSEEPRETSRDQSRDNQTTLAPDLRPPTPTSDPDHDQKELPPARTRVMGQDEQAQWRAAWEAADLPGSPLLVSVIAEWRRTPDKQRPTPEAACLAYKATVDRQRADGLRAHVGAEHMLRCWGDIVDAARGVIAAPAKKPASGNRNALPPSSSVTDETRAARKF